jgi:hypothetical protein
MAGFRRSMPRKGVFSASLKDAQTEEKTEAAQLRSPVAGQAENGMVASRAGPPLRDRGAHHPALPATRHAAPPSIQGLSHAIPPPATSVAPRDPTAAHHRKAHAGDDPDTPAGPLDARARSFRDGECASRPARRCSGHPVCIAARSGDAGSAFRKRRSAVAARSSVGTFRARTRSGTPCSRRRERARTRSCATPPGALLTGEIEFDRSWPPSLSGSAG